MTEDSSTPVNKLSNRLIAFADILGFSRRLQQTPVDEIHAIYSALMDHANQHIFVQDDHGDPGHRNFARAEFLFDSVVLISHPLDGEHAPRSVADFLSALASLFESSLGHAMPLRGAVTIGEVLEDESRRIVLSSAIPALLASEKEQEWAGIRILPNAVDPILLGLYGSTDSVLARDSRGHVVVHNVPTKTGLEPDSFVLNWPYLCSQRNIDAALQFLEGRKRTETAAFSDKVRRAAPGASLGSAYLPAARVLVRTSRVGFTIQIHDADGNGVDLPAGTNLKVIVHTISGEEKKYDVAGEGKTG